MLQQTLSVHHQLRERQRHTSNICALSTSIHFKNFTTPQQSILKCKHHIKELNNNSNIVPIPVAWSPHWSHPQLHGPHTGHTPSCMVPTLVTPPVAWSPQWFQPQLHGPHTGSNPSCMVPTLVTPPSCMVPTLVPNPSCMVPILVPTPVAWSPHWSHPQ